MSAYSPVRRCFLLWLFACLGLGCSTQPSDQGVAARVNGEPILLAQLEARHDLKFLARPGSASATLELLRSEYGLALAEMIVDLLVTQFLESRGMGVGKHELEVVEARVRADYPGGAFEQMLIEEYIDLDLWRDQLRHALNHDRLQQRVLRPQISIDYQEVDAYFRENIVDFYLQPRVGFLLIQGPEQGPVEKVAELALAGEDPRELTERFDRVEVHAYTLNEESLPREWRAFLNGLEPGEATAVVSRTGQGYFVLVLQERTPGRIVDLTQAYPLVERVLVERKLREAFEAWLAEQLGSARIEVNTGLLQGRAAAAMPDGNGPSGAKSH